MKTLNIIRFVFRLWLAAVALLSVSCTKEPETQEPTDVTETPTTLTLTVAHPDAILVRSKADDKGPYDIPYTEAESAVRNLVFFIFDVDSEGNESINTKQIFEVTGPEFEDGLYTFRRGLHLEPGKKHIYVAANITAEHLKMTLDAVEGNSSFRMEDVILAGDTPDAALANVIRDDMTHTGQGTDILMFAQAFSGDVGTPEYEIEIIDSSSETYHLGAQLKRLVTKVLVTCKEGEAGFVASGGKFIIPTADIRYCLNTTAKQIYLKERYNETAGINEDTDWKLQNYSDMTGEDSYLSRYFYCSGSDLIGRIQDPRYSTVPQAYDESKLQLDKNHYTEGLYCLENTVDRNGLTTITDETARFATTHIAIKARMIPRLIQRMDLSDMNLTGYENQHAGGTGFWYWKNALVAGIDEKDENRPYPAGTYWALTQDGVTTYYGKGGRDTMIAQNKATLSEFVKYEGGYSWFYTFIEGGINTTDGNILSYVGDSYWGVQRNNYYIVNISGIKKTGEPEPAGDFIRINSQTTEWVSRGSDEVVINPIGE